MLKEMTVWHWGQVSSRDDLYKLWWREPDKTNDDERVDVSGGKSKDDRQVNSPAESQWLHQTCPGRCNRHHKHNKFKQKKQNEESCPHQACLAEETSLNRTLLDACITYNLYALCSSLGGRQEEGVRFSRKVVWLLCTASLDIHVFVHLDKDYMMKDWAERQSLFLLKTILSRRCWGGRGRRQKVFPPFNGYHPQERLPVGRREE